MEGSSIYIDYGFQENLNGVLKYWMPWASYLMKQVQRDILSVTEAKKFNKLLFT